MTIPTNDLNSSTSPENNLHGHLTVDPVWLANCVLHDDGGPTYQLNAPASPKDATTIG